MMIEDNQRQDDLIEKLNTRMMNCDASKDEALVKDIGK